MKITEENVTNAIAALRQCAKENRRRFTETGKIKISNLCDDVADYLETQKINKA